MPSRVRYADGKPIALNICQCACIGLVAVSVLTLLIQSVIQGGFGFGNIAFMLMAVIAPLSRRVERASGPAVPDHAPG